MNKQLFVNNIFSLIIFIGFLFLNSNKLYCQNFISQKEFNKKITKDIVVIEFWADWNYKNKFEDLSKLNECLKYRVDIGQYENIKEEYNISSLPTVIIFNKGKEYIRFKANIMFELEASKKDIQKVIDNLLLEKFK